MKIWKAALIIVITIALGGVTGHVLRASSVPRAWPATPEEVRDAERIQSARLQIEQQTRTLVSRAQARIGQESITYDFERLAWVEVMAPVTSVAAVGSAK